MLSVMKIIVQSVLTHTFVGTCLFGTIHVLRKWNSQIRSYVVCLVGKGLALILLCLRGFLVLPLDGGCQLCPVHGWFVSS